MRKVLSAEVNAKINLSLAITGRIGKMHTLDGYMHSISISDKVTVSEGECGIYKDGLPDDTHPVQFLLREMKEYGLPDIRVDIEKGIPFSAGLGGSSADIAAVLSIVSKAYGVDFDGLKFGSDVPFMIEGGLARVQGTGDIITKVEPLELNLVICKGKGSVNTAEAYKLFDKEGVQSQPSGEVFTDALRVGDFSRARKYLVNDLQKVAEIINPDIVRTCTLVKKYTDMVLMSGSGSAVFGIFQSEKEAKLAAEGLKGEIEYVSFAKTLPFGVTVY